MTKPPSTVSMFVDAIVVAFIAVLTVQGLRQWCGDRYLVPSGSMEPVLYGDREAGDIVFVNKTVTANSVGRGDLVVVENRTRPGHQFVKRIAASGDEKGKTWINISNGDIFLGDSRQQMKREVKDPAAAMSRSVTWGMMAGGDQARSVFDLRAIASATGDRNRIVANVGPWSLPPCETALANVRSAFRIRAHDARHKNLSDGVLPSGMLGTNRPVDATFIDLAGFRSQTGESTNVIDCGIEVGFANRPNVILASIDTTDFTTTFVWRAEGNSLAVWLNGRAVHNVANVLADEWRGKLTFGRLDGRDFLMLDDAYTLPLPTLGKATSPLPSTYLHIGVVGETAASISDLRVFRDIYAMRILHELSIGQPKWPLHIEPGHWFLLGDNSFDSEDSRYFGSQPSSAFIGVPTYVIGPWSRIRKLTP